MVCAGYGLNAAVDAARDGERTSGFRGDCACAAAREKEGESKRAEKARSGAAGHMFVIGMCGFYADLGNRNAASEGSGYHIWVT